MLCFLCISEHHEVFRGVGFDTAVLLPSPDPVGDVRGLSREGSLGVSVCVAVELSPSSALCSEPRENSVWGNSRVSSRLSVGSYREHNVVVSFNTR